MIISDQSFAEPLQAALEDAGHPVQRATSVMTGLTLAREVPPSLVVVDAVLPDGPGRDVLRRLRLNSTVPVFVLTACDVPEETVELMQAGADQVLVKPMVMAEMVARIGARLRRSQHQAHLLSHGLVVWPQRHLVTFQGYPLPLTKTERQLLTVLLQRVDQPLSRSAIVRELWPEKEHSRQSNVIDAHMTTLRAKLGLVHLQGLITTVRRVGYVIRQASMDELMEPPVIALEDQD
ncbi:response regulator transcription factor (plasmid) [Deinococcus sp. KNUC1210]|uniref:response regulator transcription factor n=1 Tax=Deinococcus sp. KNUC1210 TaxID=2917691 RepID=UPI001EF01672|nr:response regulator transcription factor [Deinococcus sp. KNUC1210]ULH18034.1 response regulator transcription factor [Deinococcus sp. KNUC1210]